MIRRKLIAFAALASVLAPAPVVALEETWTSSKNAANNPVRNLPAPTEATNPARRDDVSPAAAGYLKGPGSHGLPITSSATIPLADLYTTSVANVTALEALTGSGYRDGARVYVQSLAIDFVYYATSSLTVDHITVGSASGAAGARWIRSRAASSKWAAVTTWFVDPANSSAVASDENDGSTIGAPLRTWAELSRRLLGAFLTQATVTITLMSDTLTSDALVLQGISTSQRTMTIQVVGTTTVIATGTISAVHTPTAITDNDHYEITDAGNTFTSWLSTYLLHRTSGTASWFWPYKDLGSHKLQVSFPVDDSGFTARPLSAADTYEVLSLPKFTEVYMQSVARQVTVSLLKVSYIGATPLDRPVPSTTSPLVEVRHSLVGATGSMAATATNASRLFLTNVCTATSVITGSLTGNIIVTGGLFTGNGTTSAIQTVTGDAEWTETIPVTLGGIRILFQHRSKFEKVAAMVYDWAGSDPMFVVSLNSHVYFSAVGGERNSGKIVQSDRSSYAIADRITSINAAITTDATAFTADSTSYAALPVYDGVAIASLYPFPSTLFETSGPTRLTIGAIANGALTKRSGSTLIGATSGTDYAPAGNYITALTGDGTASGPGSAALTLTSVVSAGSCTYCSATFDVKGRATAFSSGAAPALASRTLTAGAGMTGGGDLSADRTFNVIANADGTIVVNADDVQVGVIGTANIAADAVTFPKIQNIATDTLIGRDTASTGDPESISVGGGIEFTGSGGIQTSAFTGDATKAAGGTALTLATVGGGAGSCTYCSVTFDAKGRQTAYSSGTAPPADISGAHYVTTQAEAGLSAESSLGALASGMLGVTVSAGVATPTSFAAGSARVPFGSGSNGAFTDSSEFTYTSGVLQLGTGTTSSQVRTIATSSQPAIANFWKDVSATKAVSFGNGLSGSAPTDDAIVGLFTGSTWVEGMRIANATRAVTIGVGATGARTSLIDPDDLGNYAQMRFYPASGTNVGELVDIIPRGTGFSSTNKAQIRIFNTDAVAAPSAAEFFAMRAVGSAGFIFGTGNTGGGASNRDLMFASGWMTDGVTNNDQLLLKTDGTVKMVSLAGTGTRFVTATAAGLLGTDSTTYVPTTRTISTTAPITGGGDLSANRTFALTTPNSGRVIAGNSGGTGFDSSDEIRIDTTNDYLLFTTDGALVQYHVGTLGSANYERVRTFDDGGQYHVLAEAGGTGNVDNISMRFEAPHVDICNGSCISYFSVQGTGQLLVNGSKALPSATFAVADSINLSPVAVVSGSTPTVELDGVHIQQFSINTAATIASAAGLRVETPIIGGGGSITNPYSIIAVGKALFTNGGNPVFELPNDATGNTSAAIARVPVTVNGVTRYIRIYSD